MLLSRRLGICNHQRKQRIEHRSKGPHGTPRNNRPPRVGQRGAGLAPVKLAGASRRVGVCEWLPVGPTANANGVEVAGFGLSFSLPYMWSLIPKSTVVDVTQEQKKGERVFAVRNPGQEMQMAPRQVSEMMKSDTRVEPLRRNGSRQQSGQVGIAWPHNAAQRRTVIGTQCWAKCRATHASLRQKVPQDHVLSGSHRFLHHLKQANTR